jgi:enoyl-CoA hydratase/carnithine racemase
MSSGVQYVMHSGVATILLAAPASGNVLNKANVEQIAGMVQRAGSEESCRVIVIAAEGPDFCRGMDFDMVLEDRLDTEKLGWSLVHCLRSICDSSKPVIACIEGNVMGGGMGLVASCDLILAAPQATFMLPEVVVGMVPALITPFLLRRMPAGKAQYMAISSRSIGALEAMTFGLVDEVTTEGMEEALNRQVRRLFCSSPQAIATVKGYIERLHGPEFDKAMTLAVGQLVSWLEEPEAVAGIRAFAEGFTPPWFQKNKVRSHAASLHPEH